MTVAKPGSPVDGMQLVLPAGAVTAPLSVSLGHRPLSVPLPAGLNALSPVISIASDGPGLTKAPYTIRIPATVPAGAVPIAVVYDTLSGLVSAIPASEWDATSVTVLTIALNGANLRRPSAAASPGSALRSGGGPQNSFSSGMLLTIAVSVTNPGDIITPFTPGQDNWEFDAQPTVWGIPNTAAGQVLSEWLSTSGPLYNRTIRAPGVGPSNAGAIMLSAGISRDFDEIFPGTLGSAALRTPRNVKRQQSHLDCIKGLMKAQGTPYPVMLLDAAGHYTVVLAIGWDEQGQYLRISDPTFHLSAQQLKWSGGLMVPYNDGTWTYDEPVFVGWYSLFDPIPPQVAQVVSPVSPEYYASQWPAWHLDTWDTKVRGSGKAAADTIFLLGDTTRIWVSSASPGGPTPAVSLPVLAGDALQPLVFYKQVGSGWTFYSSPADGSGVFLDYSFAQTPTNPWVNEAVGVQAQVFGTGNQWPWMGWQEVRIIKFGVKLRPIRAAANIPVMIAANTLGGPALPANAKYEWEFVEEGQTVTVAGSPSVQHSFPANGIYNIRLTVRNAKGDPIAKTSTTADIGNILSVAQSPNYTLDPSQPVTFDATYAGPPIAHPLYMWHMGDAGNTSIPTTTPTVQYAYPLPTALTSKTYTMTLELFNGDTLVATASVFPRVSSGDMQAWRIETFTQVGPYTGFNPGTPSNYIAAVNYQDGFLSQVRTTPGDGFILLQPPGSEPGIFFEVVAPGTGNTVTYYQPGAFLAMVARTQGNNSFFVNGGNDHAGTINGAAYFGLQPPPGLTAGSFLNLITAVKNGDVLTGTLTFKLDTSWGGGIRVFDFKANRVN